METLEHLTKEEWLIRLMQGMVGDYGSNKAVPMQCYYSMQRARFEMVDERHRVYELHVNDLRPRSTYWITDTKDIEVQPINLHNIGGN